MKNHFFKSLAVALFLTMLSLSGNSQSLLTEVQVAGDFDFGPSSDGNESNFTKSFGVYAGTSPVYVIARVSYARRGSSDIPIKIELKSPDGTSAVHENRTAGRCHPNNNNEENCDDSIILLTTTTNSRCSRPWQLVISARNSRDQEIAPPNVVFGTFEVRFKDAESITTTLPLFGVVQGNPVQQPILAPSTPGELTITAAWDSNDTNPFDGSDPQGLKLRFTLLRNGRQVGEPARGYAQNALFGHASPKMVLRYRVTAADLEGNDTWAINVRGSSQGNASNIKVTTKLAPSCQ